MQISEEEKKFKEFIRRWLDGVGFEVSYWNDLIADDKSWLSYVGNRNIQDKSLINSNVKKILDAGSGPITVLNPSNDCYIFSCDPLADYYKFLIEKYKRTPIVNTEFCFSERLYEKYKSNFFDEVHMQNALDHSFFPMNAIYNFLYVVKVNGKITLKHYRNEAEFENYSGFHQYNIDVQDGKAVIWNKEIRYVLDDELKNIADINAYIDNNIFSREASIIEITKKNDFNILDYISNNYYFDRYLFLTSSTLQSLFYIDPDKELIYGKLKKTTNLVFNYNKFVKALAFFMPTKKLKNFVNGRLRY